MSDAMPERIWLYEPDEGVEYSCWTKKADESPGKVMYIREDIHQAELAKLQEANEQLREAAINVTTRWMSGLPIGSAIVTLNNFLKIDAPEGGK